MLTWVNGASERLPNASEALRVILSSAEFPVSLLWEARSSGLQASVKAGKNTISLISGSASLLTERVTSLKLFVGGETVSPASFRLEQNYPNPFNPSTEIGYSVPVDGMVTLKIYDVLGKESATLVNELQKAGRFSILFDGSNFPSGVYFYKLSTGNFVGMKKLLLMK